MTDSSVALLALVKRDRSALLAALDDLGPRQRTDYVAAFPVALNDVRGDVSRAQLLVTGIAVGVDPELLAQALHPGGCDQLLRTQPLLDYAVAVLCSRSREYLASFAEHACARRDVVTRLPRLLDQALDAKRLPLPLEAGYWHGWVQGGALPEAGARWQERFLLACATPGAFKVANFNIAARTKEIREAIAALRADESLDDAVLLDGLLDVLERGESRDAHAVALVWFDALDLAPLLWDVRSRLVASIGTVPGAFARQVLTEVLRPELSDADLIRLALGVLSRRERGLRRSILAELTRIEVPTLELREAVEAASDSDPALHSDARIPLEQWARVSSWHEPEAPPPAPVAGLDGEALLLDEDGLAKLIKEVAASYAGDPMTHERALACLVATAAAGRLEEIRAAVAYRLGLTGFVSNLLENAILRVNHPAQRDPVPPGSGGMLLELLAQRAASAIDSLGQIPCLLSTPTHSDFRITWDAFQARARQFRHSEVELLPADLAIALGRLDAATLPRWAVAVPDVPIKGTDTTLHTVMWHWRRNRPEPGELVLLSPERGLTRWHNRVAARLVAQGDDSTVHSLLGLDDAWARPYRPARAATPEALAAIGVHLAFDDSAIRSTLAEIPPVLTLLPNHPTRPAAVVIHTLMERGPEDGIRAFAPVAATARPWGRPVTIAWFMLASAAEGALRQEVAELLARGWDEGRITGEDLLHAWHTRIRRAFDPVDVRVAETLILTARAGGQPAAWPLLADMVDHLATQAITAPTEALLADLEEFVPEARAAGIASDLPGITSLAEREGSIPAIQVARRIVGHLRR